MKARVKATGQIFELFPYVYDIDGNDVLLEEVELLDNPNWQHYRIQAAIAAMQGMLANPSHHTVQVESGVPFSKFYAINAVICADDLVAELQKKGGEQ